MKSSRESPSIRQSIKRWAQKSGGKTWLVGLECGEWGEGSVGEVVWEEESDDRRGERRRKVNPGEVTEHKGRVKED